MQYEKQNFADGQTLSAEQLNRIEEGIAALFGAIMLAAGEGEGSIVRVIHDADTAQEGAQPTATGESSISLGRYCRVPGKNAMAVNYLNDVKAKYGFAANFSNVIGENANASFACGDRNEVYAQASFVAGLLNDILEEAVNGFVAGQQNILKVPNGARFGKFCTEDSTALFAIGNGHGTQSRSNAFEVFEDGTMALNGEVFTAEELRGVINSTATVETALDEIIAIQEALIGGASA